jgi:hypothetical protein
MSSEPTQNEIALFDHLLTGAQHLAKPVVLAVLCGAARRWKDIQRWSATLAACTSDRASLPGLDEIGAASAVFGFSALATTYVPLFLCSSVG